MANMKEVNKYIKTNYPQWDITAYRGDGYVYFVFGVHEIPSLYVHPVSTETNTLVDMVLAQIQDYLIENDMVV